MPLATLARHALLPELSLDYVKGKQGNMWLSCHRQSSFEVCPKCALPSSSVYDHRWVKAVDAPWRGKRVFLRIRKRRFFCKGCRKPFTEYIPGIQKGGRFTERFKRSLTWASENFSDLRRVQAAYRCSRWMIYKSVYQQLELRRRSRLSYPWPKVVGIDEHAYKKNRRYGHAEFATVVVDHNNRRVFELVDGRTGPILEAGLGHISGRENVRWVSMDLSTTYRSFAKSFFPNAEIVADKFHVVRLLFPAINRYRKEITGDKRTNPVRRLLLRSSKRLELYQKSALRKWLDDHPTMREIYHFKEALAGLYRVRGYERAKRAFTSLTDRMGLSQIPEIQTLRRTLISWRQEILNYFITGLTNARVEGFNNKAMIVRTRAYGYRSFQNYRLRVLNA